MLCYELQATEVIAIKIFGLADLALNLYENYHFAGSPKHSWWLFQG